MRPQRAIVLAAGRGSRLGGATDSRPKCLVPVLGRPLLEWQLAALAAAGITDVGIVRGYKGQMLERPGITAFENPNWASSNMVRSLLCASEWLRESACIVSYSDLLYFGTTVERLADVQADLAITFDRNWRAQWEARFADPLIDAETFAVNDAGLVTDIGRKPSSLDEINGQYMGLLKFTPPGWAVVEAYLLSLDTAIVDNLDMTSLLQRLIGSGVRVIGVGIDDPWFEVDSESDLKVCEATLPGLSASL